MLLKQNMIILMIVMSLTAFSCVDVPTTAPPLTETIKAAKANAKTDEAVDVKTFEKERATKSNDRKDEIE